MNFRFNLRKATEVACLLLQHGGGRMNIMKLVKLVYLLDRLSLDRRGIPVAGGDHLSMRNGPVTSELLDLINAGRLVGESDTRWEQCVSDRRNHDIQLERMPEREHLADAEVALLDGSGRNTAARTSGNSWTGVTPTAPSGRPSPAGVRRLRSSASAWCWPRLPNSSTG